MNNAQSPLNGCLWSTSVALVRIPRFAHSWQNGSRRSCAGRRSSRQIGKPYQRCQDSLSAPRSRLGRCSGHQPSFVNSPHPGCLQGRSGLDGISTPFCPRSRRFTVLQAKQKSPSQHPRLAVQWLRLKGSGSAIFKSPSQPHSLQCTGRFFALVAAVIGIKFFFPQAGHLIHPALAIIVTLSGTFCNAFHRLF